MIFVILPNQLFEETIKLKSYSKIYLLEEPHYFSTTEIKPNKVKIAYMRSCMKFYYDKLKKEGFKVIYKNYSSLIKNNYNFLKKDNCYFYDINDFKLKAKYNKFNIKINEIETPMFIMKKEDLDSYNRNNPNHASFYEYVKKKIGILEGIKNQDIYNRSNPKDEIKINSNLIINDR